MFQLHPRPRLLPSLLLLCLCSLASSAFAAKPQTERWVGTWATSPMAVTTSGGKIGSSDITYREIVHVSLGGSSVRIALSNEFGVEPLIIGAARVALSAGHGEINPTTDSALTFSGNPSIVIPPGGMVVSDPAALKLPAFADLAVSIYLPPQGLSILSMHTFADQTSYTAPGDVVGEHSLAHSQEMVSWPILKAVDVLGSPNAAAVVAFGDSITDGAHSTLDANARWSDVLAQRLHDNPKTANIAVLNQGIGGNRILHDITGPSALARFDRDVLSQPGVQYLIILEGINDIGHAQDPVRSYDVVTAQDLIAGFTQLINRAHLHGIKVIGATLTPYVGAKYQSSAGEAIRQALNNWIRTTKDLDGVVDFDKATRDPANPAVFAPANDSGDHLHPADPGYKAMGNAIDLTLFN